MPRAERLFFISGLRKMWIRGRERMCRKRERDEIPKGKKYEERLKGEKVDDDAVSKSADICACVLYMLET